MAGAIVGVCMRVRCFALLLCAGLQGCAVVTVADAAVTVVATTVKVGATVVGTAVDVAAAGVDAAIGDDDAAQPGAD